MRTKEVTFIIKFDKPQDYEEKGNDLDKVYSALDKLFEDGVISDYNCSESVDEE